MSLQKCVVRIVKFEPFNTDVKFTEFQFAEAKFVTVGFQALHTSRRSLYQDTVVKVDDKPKEELIKNAWDVCKPIFEAWADACSEYESVIGVTIQTTDHI